MLTISAMSNKLFTTVNPYHQQVVGEYLAHDLADINRILTQAEKAFPLWKNTTHEQRATLFLQLSSLLTQKKESLAALITNEMGKLYTEALAEVEKCTSVCAYYAENTAHFLADTVYELDKRHHSFVSYEPLGAILGIMPWNFPFWQTFRYAIPALAAGNVTILKAAANTFGSGVALEKLFEEAGFPIGVFQNILIENDQIEHLIAHPIVQGVTLTGSERAGKSVAMLSGKYLKKCVLELGGSDPLIVLSDADVPKAVSTALKSRLLNAGQSCIAAKRFIVAKEVAEQFTDLTVKYLQSLQSGNPFDSTTTIATLARADLAENAAVQCQKSLKEGATKLWGSGRAENTFFQPTLLTGITPNMTVFREETFAPLISITVAKDETEAISLANQSDYGLGCAVWSADVTRALAIGKKIQTGAVFVNSLVRSDTRLPFGGIKQSGYGRELAEFGLKEFTNLKTYVIEL
jgi:succinate-semialdehyde dehydrogenase/glutarate-semialdehyde dehydrogenase